MALVERILSPIAQLKESLWFPRPRMAQDGVMQTATAPIIKPRKVVSSQKDALIIPCPDPTAEERAQDKHTRRGQKLARIEDWEQLSAEVRKADVKRRKTPGGLSVAELIASGARSDVVSAVEHALVDGEVAPDAPIMAGIEALEHLLAEMPDDIALAAIVAMTHIDLAWAWRGTCHRLRVSGQNLEAFHAHLDRADAILADFDPVSYDSPLLGATHYALTAARGRSIKTITQMFENWTDLDPMNARAYRAYGMQMLPRWNGSYDQLELAARRAAARTHDIWGAGAYTWVNFDAISCDPEACARIDLDFLLEGLDDILSRKSDQHTVNTLLAYCANTMGVTQTGNDKTDHMRAQIADAATWIVQDHLTELHPLLWAHAARGFDNSLRIRCVKRFAASGYADAMHFLNQTFRHELAEGCRIVFTKNGAEKRPA